MFEDYFETIFILERKNTKNDKKTHKMIKKRTKCKKNIHGLTTGVSPKYIYRGIVL